MELISESGMNQPPIQNLESPQIVVGLNDSVPDHDKPPRIHIGFVDAFRALAALYVVVGHAIRELLPYQKALMVAHPQGEKIFSFISVAFFRFGHLAVAIFIVISGFCLMLPLARNDKVRMESIKTFIARRAWRILPPYYAALAVSLFLMILVPKMNDVVYGQWFDAIPAFGVSTIVSHLLLVHHWSDQWIGKIDPPLWSIGVEWQMYFLMPLFFLPLLRELGRIKMILVTAIFGIILTYAGIGWLPKTQDYVHFIALFAAGMVAAQVCFSPNSECRHLRRSFPSSRCFFILFALILILLGLTTRQSWDVIPFIHILGKVVWSRLWVMDYLVTACFCFLLISLCQEVQSKPVQGIKKFLNWTPLIFIGHFSYSIYLIHDPILRLVCTAGEFFNFSALTQYFVLLTFGVSFAVFCGYVLYWLVERHFIKNLPVLSRGN